MDRLENMRAFAAVAKEGSFTAAARRLGVSTKLVSKYVRQLEERLDTQLLNRTTRSVTLTDAGRSYLHQCRAIVEQVDELELSVRERQTALAGPIRITAPTGFGSTRLVEALAPFTQSHPEVEIDLSLSDRHISLVDEGLDLAVRVGTLRDSTLMARQLAAMPLIVCAAPEYLSKHGYPQHPRDLTDHECLLDDNQDIARTWQFQHATETIRVKVQGRLRANAPAALARFALAGLGIARCPQYVVSEHLAAGRLAPLLSDFRSTEFGLYALYPLNRHLTRRVRALIDHLADYFGTSA
ncbi:MAG: LysR family transcriptional regulator [Pseudomonadota bacterium]